MRAAGRTLTLDELLREVGIGSTFIPITLDGIAAGAVVTEVEVDHSGVTLHVDAPSLIAEGARPLETHDEVVALLQRVVELGRRKGAKSPVVELANDAEYLLFELGAAVEAA